MTDFEKAIRAQLHCRTNKTDCSNCILADTSHCHKFIDDQFVEYLRNKEKEPAASVDNCTDSSEDVSISSFPEFDNTTSSEKSQVLSGVEMFENVAAMLVNLFGKDFEITEIEAYGLSFEMKFKHGEETYGISFTNETRADDVD